ncbi:hypothetical protein PtA15_9A528 [Puccinia triticina]|uniref:HPt domain-containing protein n=1 Tax=Puccinia triticina TaxID=208348 RepID=A0ABY7CT07_9BASI|nr:uncharacterized protein PtA15_9A528 [Puccinia triticina]WAQ88401.1 hypothetical protein PtA15_9A528 [Puccinia triticina]
MMPDPQPRADSEGRAKHPQANGTPSKARRSPSRSKPAPIEGGSRPAEGSRPGRDESGGRAEKPGSAGVSPDSPAAATSSASSEDGTDESVPSKPGPRAHDHEDEAEDGPLVDMETFGQLLEMDDDEEHSFSKSLTWDYFDQAVTTFKEMDAAVLGGDLITLSRKGHFLKGSSAALGLNRVKASCEKMQHYGNKKRANGEGALTEAEAMEHCKTLLEQLKQEQTLSKAWLERFYAERNI